MVAANGAAVEWTVERLQTMVAGDVGARLQQSIWRCVEKRLRIVRLPIATSIVQVHNWNS